MLIENDGVFVNVEGAFAWAVQDLLANLIRKQF